MTTGKYIKSLHEFIKLYSELPAVWKIKSKEYKDRQMKNEAYDILVKKYKEIDGNADREMVRKKINVLRTNFRRELAKIKSSRLSVEMNGGIGGEVYVPSLWYFKDLEFLTEVTEQEESTVGLVSDFPNAASRAGFGYISTDCGSGRYSGTRLDVIESMESHEATSSCRGRSSEMTTDAAQAVPENPRQSKLGGNPDFVTEQRRQPRKRNVLRNRHNTKQQQSMKKSEVKNILHKNKIRKSKKINELISLASEYLHQPEDDEATMNANIWATEFRKLTPEQQLYAKKAINDIFFEARLGRLHREYVQNTINDINPIPIVTIKPDRSEGAILENNNFA